MSPSIVIARLTWTELLRDRFVVLFGFLAGLLLVLSSFLGSLTLDEQKRLLVHLGFASFQITLVGLALFIGSWSLQKELDRQTCLLVLSRPVTRAQFVLGKWLGSLALLTFFWMLCGVFHLVLLGFDVPLENFLIAHATLWIEATVMLSLAYCFASFLKPLLSLACCLTLWLGAHWREDMAYFAKRNGSDFFRSAVPVADWIFPPLNRLEIRTLAFVEGHDGASLLWPVIHLFFWAGLSVYFAQLIWRRRDLV